MVLSWVGLSLNQTLHEADRGRRKECVCVGGVVLSVLLPFSLSAAVVQCI